MAMGSPNQQPEKMEGEEADWADTSDSESEEEEAVEESSDEEEGVETRSEVAIDFCIHQMACSSAEKCSEYEEKINQDYEYLKAKERMLLGQRRTLMEKRRAMQLFRQTMAVQIKVRELERVIEWMRKAARKKAEMDAELASIVEDSRLAGDQLEFFEAAMGKE